MNEHSVRDFFLLFLSLGQTMAIPFMERGETYEVLFYRSSCFGHMDCD